MLKIHVRILFYKSWLWYKYIPKFNLISFKSLSISQAVCENMRPTTTNYTYSTNYSILFFPVNLCLKPLCCCVLANILTRLNFGLLMFISSFAPSCGKLMYVFTYISMNYCCNFWFIYYFELPSHHSANHLCIFFKLTNTIIQCPFKVWPDITVV